MIGRKETGSFQFKIDQWGRRKKDIAYCSRFFPALTKTVSTVALGNALETHKKSRLQKHVPYIVIDYYNVGWWLELQCIAVNSFTQEPF